MFLLPFKMKPTNRTPHTMIFFLFVLANIVMFNPDQCALCNLIYCPSVVWSWRSDWRDFAEVLGCAAVSLTVMYRCNIDQINRMVVVWCTGRDRSDLAQIEVGRRFDVCTTAGVISLRYIKHLSLPISELSTIMPWLLGKRSSSADCENGVAAAGCLVSQGQVDYWDLWLACGVLEVNHL